MLLAQHELSGSGGFNLISSAKPESLQGQWLGGFSLIIIFFPAQGQDSVYFSLQQGDESSTSDPTAAGAPHSPALLTGLPLAFCHPRLPLRVP